MINKTETLRMQSINLVEKNIEKISELFPGCVTEADSGKKIDFDLLRQELSENIVDGIKERYRLEWPGKREAIVNANLPSSKTLRPKHRESINFENTKNIYIEGDNLEVLKLLQESYLNKVKLIYIDPPYNTGKDFIYRDNFSKDKGEDLLESGQINDLGQRLFVNSDSSGRYHSDWISMIYPRLKLARNLLANDGVIFISIDDNELFNLYKICCEIFGESNFIGNIVWRKKYGIQNDAKYFSTSHEYIICFARNAAFFKPNLSERSEEQNNRYKNPDNDPRGPWMSDNLSVGRVTEKDIYEITTPSGRKVMPPSGSSWRVSKEKFQSYVADNRIWFGGDGENTPRIKRFLSEVKQGITTTTFWDYDEVGHTDGANKTLKALFDGKQYFDYPKPVALIKKILSIGTNEKSIVLDFFSGSATLAEAVFELNLEKNLDLKFICVQLPELCESDSIPFQDGYLTICDIAKQRIIRSANKLREISEGNVDLGFRVLSLDSSNMKDIFYRPDGYDQSKVDIFADSVKADRSDLDLLFQILLDWGLPLDLEIKNYQILGKCIYKISGTSLFACFDNDIDEELAKIIAKDRPLRVVFKDSGFKDDTSKTNVRQILKQLSPETEMKVL